MKPNYLTLGVIGFLILIAVVTNPNLEQHQDTVKAKLSSYLKKKMSRSSSDSDSEWEKAGQAMGAMIGMGMANALIDNLVTTDNFLVFSMTRINGFDESRVIGIGAFGNVFLFKDFEQKLELGQRDDSKRVTNRAGDLEEKDDSENVQNPQREKLLNWEGEYNNYDQGVANYSGFGFCNPGQEDIQIEPVNGELKIKIRSRGTRMGEDWDITREPKVLEISDDYILFDSNNDGQFKFKIYKEKSKYYVKNISQEDCEDYEIVKIK